MFRAFTMIAAMLAILAPIALATLPTQATAQTLFRPVAIVNDSAITGFDLAQRAQILVALGFTSASPDALRAEALDQLVEDRLKLQAGKRIGVSPSAELIESGVENFAQQSNLSANEFRALMSSQGITDQALEDLVIADLVWLQVVRSQFRGRVEPGEAEIDAEINFTQQRSAFDYRIQEIGLPLNSEGRTEAQTRALAEQLSQSLNAGGDFAAAVSRHSEAPSAARGGEIGWVTTDRMPPDLLRALTELEVGQVSPPLPVAGGLSLIRLMERRATAGVSQAEADAGREAARDRLVAQRSQRLAEGMLQELRRDALIEIR
ncbi:MAG: peptidylprolyl isomerase [Paracoccaceae bacterium]